MDSAAQKVNGTPDGTELPLDRNERKLIDTLRELRNGEIQVVVRGGVPVLVKLTREIIPSAESDKAEYS